MIEIALDESVVEAGKFLSGEVRWVRDAERRPRRIIIAAEWTTGGAGNIATGVGRSKQVAIGSEQREKTFPFRFLIPYEGPMSFEGELITMKWSLRVRVDQRGYDEFEQLEFRVDPRRG